jgi:hypothetical protein
MYIYIVQTMPGCKAKFEGDTSVKYKVRRKYTSASADQKSKNVDIRTDLDYEEATALAAKFNDKERESRAIKHVGAAPHTESIENL